MRRAVAAASWIVLAAGCEQPRTELIARVDSEVPWGAGQTIQAVTLTVRRGGPAGPLRSTRTTVLGTGSDRRALPLTVGILPGDDLDTPIWVEALGCGDPNGCDLTTAVVVQRAVVRFTRGRTEEVPLLLASACVGAMCGSDERCGEGGRCEPATRTMVRPFDGVDAATDRGAVDAVAADDLARVDVMGVDRAATDASDGTVTDRLVADVGTDRPQTDAPTLDATASCGALELACDGVCRRVLTDPMHCGDCNAACPAVAGSTPTCMGGRCGYACDSAHADCDERPSNGCEQDVLSDPMNCGACDRICSVPRGVGGCMAGACVVASCSRGFGDCNASAIDGCETDITLSDLHCGACGTACGAGRHCQVSRCVPTTCPEGMLYITGGMFTMGSEVVEHERPPHLVRVSDFCMDRMEVTVARFRACIAAGRCSMPPRTVNSAWESAIYDGNPADSVIASQAGAFCAWSGGSLPTEAQWEYAARGTDGRAYPWGDADAGTLNICWSPFYRDGARSCPAGGSRDDVSPFGVLDMGGNVFEWTRDLYGPYPSADAGVLVDPIGMGDPSRQVARGSSFVGGNPINLRAANRSPLNPNMALASVGFRCVRAP